MSSREVVDLFNELAPPAFAFLCSEFGMIGPTKGNDSVLFDSPDFSIAIGLDGRDGIRVDFAARIASREYRASLACLYVESGLGPAQAVRTTARSSHTLQQSLASNAAALRELLPRLNGDRRIALLAACHGR